MFRYRYDTETQLYYLNSRYYNPDWGRFINGDDILGKTGELLAHNLFAYCQNNVVNMRDPSGHIPVEGAGFVPSHDTFLQMLGNGYLNGGKALGDWQDNHADLMMVFNVALTLEGIRGGGKIIGWSSGAASNAAKQLEKGATSVTVNSRAEAEELFLRLYNGKGFKNVTGMDAMDTKNLLGTKANTYHWDDILGKDGRVVGHSPTNADGAMRHLQIQPAKGKVVRIFFK